MTKEELPWNLRDFHYATEWANPETLGAFLGKKPRQIRRAYTDFTIRTLMTNAYNQKSAEELHQFIETVQNEVAVENTKLQKSIERQERQIQTIEAREYLNDRSKRPSNIIGASGIAVILTVVTTTMLPPNQISRLVDMQDAPLSALTPLDFLIGLMPLIYFGLALVAFWWIDRKLSVAQ